MDRMAFYHQLRDLPPLIGKKPKEEHMRDVLSISLAGTALLALSFSLVLAQTTTPATPPGYAVAAPAGSLADWWWVLLLAVVIAAAVWYFTRRRTTL
jgi:hypothetical protein